MKTILFLLSLFLLSANVFGQGRGTDFNIGDGLTFYTKADTVNGGSSDTFRTTCNQYQHGFGFQINYTYINVAGGNVFTIKIYGSKSATGNAYILIKEWTIFAPVDLILDVPFSLDYNINSGDGSGTSQGFQYKKIMLVFSPSGSGKVYAWQSFMLVR